VCVRVCICVHVGVCVCAAAGGVAAVRASLHPLCTMPQHRTHATTARAPAPEGVKLLLGLRHVGVEVGEGPQLARPIARITIHWVPALVVFHSELRLACVCVGVRVCVGGCGWVCLRSTHRCVAASQRGARTHACRGRRLAPCIHSERPLPHPHPPPLAPLHSAAHQHVVAPRERHQLPVLLQGFHDRLGDKHVQARGDGGAGDGRVRVVRREDDGHVPGLHAADCLCGCVPHSARAHARVRAWRALACRRGCRASAGACEHRRCERPRPAMHDARAAAHARHSAACHSAAQRTFMAASGSSCTSSAGKHSSVRSSPRYTPPAARGAPGSAACAQSHAQAAWWQRRTCVCVCVCVHVCVCVKHALAACGAGGAFASATLRPHPCAFAGTKLLARPTPVTTHTRAHQSFAPSCAARGACACRSGHTAPCAAPARARAHVVTGVCSGCARAVCVCVCVAAHVGPAVAAPRAALLQQGSSTRSALP
jgi:hypothetical protein